MVKFKLGITVKDKITGFEGIITGRSTYLTGCDQYCLQPTCSDESKGKYPDACWFDEGRLEKVLKGKKVTKKSVKGNKNGCDYSAPIK